MQSFFGKQTVGYHYQWSEIPNQDQLDVTPNEKLVRDLNEVTYKDAVLASTTTAGMFPSLTYQCDSFSNEEPIPLLPWSCKSLSGLF